MSFMSDPSTKKVITGILYFVAAAIVIWVIYSLVVSYVVPNMPKNSRLGTLLQVQDLSVPSITGGAGAMDDINDSDFNYIHGTTFTVDGLGPDPSNEVQKYRKSVDASGRAFWEPLPMTSVSDYLTKGEFDTIIDRQILDNMTPNLKYLTQPKFIRNADNFWGNYWPEINNGPLANGRCVNYGEQKPGIYQGLAFGAPPVPQ